ncbi:MAG: ATP-binding cassette domain-containing protein [candidate division KSB1 bacterium]|nr:ATP-binding cassette domain-containing protein [candidate division KSB1 bacterium]
MIETQAICKTFYGQKHRDIHAVRETTLTVREGEIFGLLGPNGAGKTTLLRMLSTVLTPTSGTARINGISLQASQEGIKKSIGFLSGNTRLYGRLTPRELLSYFGALYEMSAEQIKTRAEEIFDMLDMHEFADQRVEKLSTGQTQKTSIARTILHDPPVYILDEPTLGLDILTGRTIIKFIRESAARGKTVLFSTHYMEEAEMLCDRIALMHQGNILDVDTLENLKKRKKAPHLADVFLAYIEEAA